MIMGVHIVFYRPMVMAPIKDKIEYWLIRVSNPGIANNLMKPLFNCPVCMSSVYGSAYYWFVIRVNAIDWILYLIMLAGLIFFMMLLAYNDPRNDG